METRLTNALVPLRDISYTPIIRLSDRIPASRLVYLDSGYYACEIGQMDARWVDSDITHTPICPTAGLAASQPLISKHRGPMYTRRYPYYTRQ